MSDPALPDWRVQIQLPLLLIAVPLAAGAWWYNWRQASQIVVALAETGEPRTPSGLALPAFDLTNLTLPAEAVRAGGPRKDGIPALTDPGFLDAAEAKFLKPQDRIIGIAWDGRAKAYPLKILDYHEVVNDTLADQAIAVTYCPLCDSAVVFSRVHQGRILELGVSGLLYNSNVLVYDRGELGAESLWSQLMSRAVSGPQATRVLRRLPLEVTTWDAWRRRWPQTQVLSDRTAHQRTYDGTIYASYFEREDLYFPVDSTDERLPPKTAVLGVVCGRQAIAFPVQTLLASGQTEHSVQLEGRRFTVVADPAARSLRIEDADPALEWVYAFWFAWSAFYPDTQLWSPMEGKDQAVRSDQASAK